MLKINGLNIEIHSNNGQFGFKTLFDDYLNIIQGDNSSGKSTIFQSMLYGLGMEELVGSRNEKAMQSVLKNEILDDNRRKVADVIESSILLEIENENNSKVTIERFVKSETKSSKLIRVYHGGLLTEDSSEIESDLMYVHDPGSATDVEFGFFTFLESFLGFDLPKIQYNDGKTRKLYLQTLFPSFVIEQKVGWSDFHATIPFFNLKDKEKRAIEYILGLDSWLIEETRQELRRAKQSIEERWAENYSRLGDIARRSATEINGLDKSPYIINAIDRVFLSYVTPDKTYSLAEYVSLLEDQLFQLESNEIPKIEDISKEKELELQKESESYNILMVRFNEVQSKSNISQESINTIQERLSQIEEELTHNKHHLKIKRLASDNDLSLAEDLCPSCRQPISDSLLPVDQIDNSMNIEQNIEYLEGQRSIAQIYLKNHRKELESLEQISRSLQESLSNKRSSIRAIKRDLVSDDRLPSAELIEKRIKIQNRLEFYKGIETEISDIKDAFEELSSEWSAVLSKLETLPKESFSKMDFQKLNYLKNQFLSLLKKFDYGSKSLNDLSISKDKLIPVAEGQYHIKYNMRLDSSASDLVRAIAAYTLSLYKVSEKFNTNHPGLIMLDEPGTQETAISTLREMLITLQSYRAQSIVFASFKQSESDFKETTEGIKFHHILAPGKKFITKIEGEA